MQDASYLFFLHSSSITTLSIQILSGHRINMYLAYIQYHAK